ncbi:hypothetical protein AVEN_1362-1 [Araneus ventricosus]|uniref:Uncharacterized protein n=1 Tax=Araneus ventricosus TaxID=182803 RepID=A0A4Y1ZSP1_ARAVE|nr:hypothetical protein AVEN_1362-1 [Araneus ventricosus]
MAYFPENKISHFITRLPSPLQLHGEWELALTQFIYPHTWYNVNEKNNLIGFDLGDNKVIGRRVPPGFYETVPDILKGIALEEFRDKITFKFNESTKRVQIKVKGKARVILHDGLSKMLGFDPTEIVSNHPNVETVVESPLVPDPCAHYRVLFLYTDIVEPQIVGDVFAPLLRIVNVTGSDGEMVCVQYDRPHYIPLSRKIIDTIEIVIRTHRVDVSLNGRIISSSSNTYPYRAYLETLLNYGEYAKKSLHNCEAFFKDDKPYQVDPVSEEACESLKKRYQLMTNSRTLDMIGQLHCYLFQQNRLMLNLVDMKIKMIRSKPNFCF